MVTGYLVLQNVTFVTYIIPLAIVVIKLLLAGILSVPSLTSLSLIIKRCVQLQIAIKST